jgi:hypothetical protein
MTITRSIFNTESRTVPTGRWCKSHLSFFEHGFRVAWRQHLLEWNGNWRVLGLRLEDPVGVRVAGVTVTDLTMIP